MKNQESYWAFKAPDTPEFSDLPKGAFDGTEAGWDSLPPGYRREIYRSAARKAARQNESVDDDLKRFARADMKYEQGVAAIMAREAL